MPNKTAQHGCGTQDHDRAAAQNGLAAGRHGAELDQLRAHCGFGANAMPERAGLDGRAEILLDRAGAEDAAVHNGAEQGQLLGVHIDLGANAVSKQAGLDSRAEVFLDRIRMLLGRSLCFG